MDRSVRSVPGEATALGGEWTYLFKQRLELHRNDRVELHLREQAVVDR